MYSASFCVSRSIFVSMENLRNTLAEKGQKKTAAISHGLNIL